jgi:hypothetical protein
MITGWEAKAKANPKPKVKETFVSKLAESDSDDTTTDSEDVVLEPGAVLDYTAPPNNDDDEKNQICNYTVENTIPLVVDERDEAALTNANIEEDPFRISLPQVKRSSKEDNITKDIENKAAWKEMNDIINTLEWDEPHTASVRVAEEIPHSRFMERVCEECPVDDEMMIEEDQKRIQEERQYNEDMLDALLAEQNAAERKQKEDEDWDEQDAHYAAEEAYRKEQELKKQQEDREVEHFFLLLMNNQQQKQQDLLNCHNKLKNHVDNAPHVIGNKLQGFNEPFYHVCCFDQLKFTPNTLFDVDYTDMPPSVDETAAHESKYEEDEYADMPPLEYAKSEYIEVDCDDEESYTEEISDDDDAQTDAFENRIEKLAESAWLNAKTPLLVNYKEHIFPSSSELPPLPNFEWPQCEFSALPYVTNWGQASASASASASPPQPALPELPVFEWATPPPPALPELPVFEWPTQFEWPIQPEWPIFRFN